MGRAEVPLSSGQRPPGWQVAKIRIFFNRPRQRDLPAAGSPGGRDSVRTWGGNRVSGAG